MPTQRAELFSLSATTPAHAAVHGSAALHGSAQASATFRRGFDLSAGFEFSAVLSADVGKQAYAALDAGASARAGLSLRAEAPLNLFGEAGMVARFRAQAEAAAYVKLRLGLSIEEFYELVASEIPDGPMRELLGVFLSEVAAEAGVWGRASFSAQALGEVALVGTLLPGAPGGPGFTATARYAVGWGFGAGVEVMANVGIEDPHRLLRRLAESTASIAIREIEQLERTAEPGVADTLRGAAPLLRLLLPMAAGTLFELGYSIATASGDEAEAQARETITTAFVREAQQVFLRTVFDAAMERLAGAVALPEVAALARGLTGDRRDALLAHLVDLRDALGRLDAVPWLGAVVDIVSELDALLADVEPDLPPATTERARHAVALVWAAGTLLARVAAWRDDPSAAVGSIFGTTPVPELSGSAASYIAASLGLPADRALTLADLARFIAGQDIGDALSAAAPWSGAVLDFVRDALATPAGELAQKLLVDLADPAIEATDAVLQAIAAVMTTAVRDHVVPDVLQPLKEADPSNVALAAFVDEMLAPMLTALPLVVLPRVPTLDDPDERLRLTEALSSVLLQSLTRFVVVCADVLLQRGLEEGAAAMRVVGTDIETMGDRSPAFGVVAMAASRAVLPVAVTPRDAKGILDLAADVMEMWNDRGRGPTLQAARAVLDLGLANEDAREARLAAILDSNEPDAPELLRQALDLTTAALWEIVEFVTPRLLLLVAEHFINEAMVIAEAIYEGAKAVVAAAVAAVEWLGEQLEALRQRLLDFARDIGVLAAQILADIRALTAHLRTLVGDIVDRIRDAGFTLVDPLIKDFPKWARDALRSLYSALVDAIEWLATTPLLVLESVAGWVERYITDHLETIGNDEQGVHAAVRQQIQQLMGSDLTFDLSLKVAGQTVFDIGRVTIPASDVAGTAADVILGDPVYTQTVRAAANGSVDLQAMRAQEAVTRGAYEELLEKPEAQATAAEMLPGRALAVTLASPLPGEIASGRATVEVRVDGANATFLAPTLGVPARIAMRLNGADVVVPAGAWRVDASGASLTLRIQPPAPAPTAVVPTIVHRVVGTVGTNVVARATPDGHDLELRAAKPSAAGTFRSYGTLDGLGAARSSTALRRAVAPADGVGRRVVVHESAEVEAAGSVAYTAAVAHVSPTVAPARTSLLTTLAEISTPDEMPQLWVAASPVVVTAALAADGAASVTGLLGLNAIVVSATDGEARRDSASRTFFITTEPVRDSGLRIRRIEYDPAGPEPEGEFVELENASGSSVDVRGWTLRDLARHTFTLPARVVDPGATLRIWTGRGVDSATDLYWGRRAAIWNNPGDTAVLSNSRNQPVDRSTYSTLRRRG